MQAVKMDDLAVMALVALGAKMEVLINIATKNYSTWRTRVS